MRHLLSLTSALGHWIWTFAFQFSERIQVGDFGVLDMDWIEAESSADSPAQASNTNVATG